MLLSRLIRFLLGFALSGAVLANEADEIASALKQGKVDDALAASERALKAQPKDARLRLLRGNALAQLGRSDEAVAVFVGLTREFPSLPEAFNNLAALYAQQGQLEKAQATLQMALQTNPTYATAHSNLSDIYAKRAAQAYDRALQRDVVERQNGQNASPMAGTSATKLALVQDIQGSRVGFSTTQKINGSNVKPLELKPSLAVTPPVAAKPEPIKPAPVVTAPVVTAVKPTVAPAGKPLDGAPSKPEQVKPEPIKPNQQAEEQVNRAVQAWAQAWSQKRVGGYLASYAKQFKPGGSSRSVWEQQRRERIEAARRIEVGVSQLRIKLDDEGKTAQVRFVQRYKSDKLSTSTGKTLLMEKMGERWLITEERVGS